MIQQDLGQKSHPSWGNESIGIKHLHMIPDADAAAISDGALVLRQGMVQDAGTTAAMASRYPSMRWLDGTGFLVCPGFINSHTHVSMSFFRGRGHSYQVKPGSGQTTMIEDFFFPIEKSLTPADTGPLAYSDLVDGIKSGVTSFVDAYFFMDGVARGMQRLGVRGFVGEHIADLGGPHAAGKDYWDRIRPKIDRWSWDERIKPVIYAHAADTVSSPLLRELGEFSRQRSLPFHMHLSQTSGERSRVMQRESLTPVQYASQCGVLTDRSLVVHLVSVDDADIRILKDSGVAMGYCPASEIIYERLPPIAKIQKAGIPIALGTDCAASCDSADLMAELRLAAILGKQAGWSREDLQPSALLKMVWSHPARVLGEPQLGHLHPGAKADCVFMAMDIGVQPQDTIKTNLIYSLRSRHVRHVMVAGEWVLWDQKLVKVSEADLTEEYTAAVDRIKFP